MHLFPRYVDDLPHIDGEAYASLVLSNSAHAIITVDTSALETIEVHCCEYEDSLM